PHRVAFARDRSAAAVERDLVGAQRDLAEGGPELEKTDVGGIGAAVLEAEHAERARFRRHLLKASGNLELDVLEAWLEPGMKGLEVYSPVGVDRGDFALIRGEVVDGAQLVDELPELLSKNRRHTRSLPKTFF